MKDFDEAWWNKHVTENGVTAAASDYSEWSHERRLAQIVAIMEIKDGCHCLHVVDVPCGVGLLDKKYGPFAAYDGIDFAAEACALAKKSMTEDSRITHGSVLDPNAIEKVRRGDWVVASGLFCFESMFKTSADVATMIEILLTKAQYGVIANFPWMHAVNQDVMTWRIEDICEALFDKKMNSIVHVGYLPHEFMIVVTR